MSEPSTKPQEDSSESGVKASRRREKPQLSCTLCRQKKLKCDRAPICKNCEKRPLGSCVYVHSGPTINRKVIDRTANSSSQARSISVQDRIRRLERLVISLAETPRAIEAETWPESEQDATNGESRQRATNDPDNSAQGVAGPFGRLSVDESETRFINPSHWEAILDDITEIKDAMSSPPSTSSYSKPLNAPENSEFPELLFGQRENGSATELICSLPSKPVTDELIRLFLKSLDIPPITMHVPTFYKEYEAFWENPNTVSITWLGLLHTIMALALQFVVRTNSGPITGILFPDTMARLFTKRAATCLILADYSKPTTHTIETMIMYLACEHFLSPDNEFRASLIFGIVVRLAMRSGYHRDPVHYQMTVFEGEMRRRIWALITQLDLLFSSSLGLPRLLDDRQADTVPPLNLLDEDLDPDMTEVPKPRPETEETWIGYMNFKSKPLGVLGKIVDRMNLVKEISYNEVLNLEQEIQAAVAAKPTWLKLPTNGQLANLPVSVITRLMSLDLITQRSRMILHRKYLLPAITNKNYSYSRQCCLTAATKALQYQWELFEMSRVPDGLISSSWKFFSLMTHDFLLAAMILCLDLNEVLLGKCEDVDVEEENKEREKRYKLLENSYKVWTDAMTHAPEARKAAAVLRVMLEKVEKRKMEKSATPNTEANFTSPIYKTSIGTASNASPMVEAEKVALPQPSQAVDLKPDPFLNYNGILSGEAESYLARGGYAYPNPVVFQNMLSSGGNFDWLEWDSQFPGQGLDLQP